ncbi:MAG: HDOD domain-containing protein [Devosiaceae bacterium]|nr:HDOD domain-containing protein [Devosiaceae bacterium]
MPRELIKKFVDELLDDIKANRITLPTLPEVANKIRTIVDNPNASANGLYDTLKLDAALSARLLKLANSPIFRAKKSIEDLNTVITRLGNHNIKNLITNENCIDAIKNAQDELTQIQQIFSR